MQCACNISVFLLACYVKYILRLCLSYVSYVLFMSFKKIKKLEIRISKKKSIEIGRYFILT